MVLKYSHFTKTTTEEQTTTKQKNKFQKFLELILSCLSFSFFLSGHRCFQLLVAGNGAMKGK